MVEIARASGLRQSSLYYYFHNKEHVLEAIVVEANRVPLALVEQVRRDGGPAPVQLYRIIRADVVALSALPYDLNEIHRLAGRDPETFHRYWDGAGAARRRGDRRDPGRHRRRRASATLHPRLTRAHRAVERRSHPELAAGRRRPGSARRDPGPRIGLGGPHAIGAFLADLVVRGLLGDPSTLDEVRVGPPTRSTRARCSISERPRR